MICENLEIRAFNPVDADRIRLTEIDAYTMRNLDAPNYIRAISKTGPFWSAVAVDEVVAIAGVQLLRPGIGEAWMCASDLVNRYAVGVSRAVAEHLVMVANRFQIRRLQAVVYKEHDRSMAWCQQLLGFAVEGLMRNYGAGGIDDYFMLAKFYDWGC